MKKSISYFLKILFALLLTGWSSGAFAYPGGDGSAGNPYQINTFADLQYLSETPADWGFNFIQTDVIDASATALPAYNAGAGFSPIGNSVDLFMGVYDGNNKKITNLFINRPGTPDVGLFGFTYGVIKNLGVTDVNITGGDNTGGLGGEVYEADNCYSTGIVSGTLYTGGLTGLSAYCNNSFSTCSVTGSDYVGGLNGDNVGTALNCYAMGPVSGTTYVGGLIGANEAATVQNCYSTGLVNGTSSVGGLIGWNNGGSNENCFWNKETSGKLTSDGGTGKTTLEMKMVGTYLSDPSLILAFDFIKADNLWAFNGTDNSGYPFLRYENYTPGHVWLGLSSSGWDLAGNWSENTVPGSTSKVFIPKVLTVDPSISTNETSSPLMIENGGFLTVATGSTLTIPTSLFIASGGRMTAIGSLVSLGGTAGLVIEPGASLVHHSAGVLGTVKLIIPQDKSWHLLSCPIMQTTMPEICDGNFAPLQANFNQTIGQKYDFYYWDETITTWPLNWINLKMNDWSVNTAQFGAPPRFVQGSGYLVEYFPSSVGTAIKTFAGTLGEGTSAIPVKISLKAGFGNTFNLIGNTYPSSIDWKAANGWERSALKEEAGKWIWIWNDASGNYGVYSSLDPDDVGTLGVSRYIAPEQGFFVQAAENGNVTMNDDVRCHSTQAWLKATDNNLRINVTSSVNSYSDEVKMVFGSTVTGGGEKWFSMYNDAPSLYLPVDKANYSMRFLNDVSANPSVPLSFKAGKDGSYTITAAGLETFPNVILQDLKTGTSQEMKTNPTYTFTSSTSDDANRFMLKFTPLGIDGKQTVNSAIYVFNNILNVSNPGESVITIYNMIGSKIMDVQTSNEALFQSPLQLATGYYIVTVTNGKQVRSEKVFVK